MAQNTSQMSSAALADELGRLKAAQSEMAKREKALKEAIDARMARSGGDEIDGDAFRVVRVSSIRETLDAAAVKKILTDPPMKSSIVQSFRVNARVCEAA